MVDEVPIIVRVVDSFYHINLTIVGPSWFVNGPYGWPSCRRFKKIKEEKGGGREEMKEEEQEGRAGVVTYFHNQ